MSTLGCLLFLRYTFSQLTLAIHSAFTEYLLYQILELERTYPVLQGTPMASAGTGAENDLSLPLSPSSISFS